MIRIAASLSVLVLYSSVAFAGGSYCSLPGQEVAQGQTGSEIVVGVSSVDYSDLAPGQQIQALYWAEPGGSFGDRIAMTLKVDSLAAVPPGTVYEMFFTLGDGNSYFVQYDANAALGDPQFSYGTSVANGSDTTDTILGAADPDSSAQSDGTITWIVSRDKIPALASTSTVKNIYAIVKEGAGAGGTGQYQAVNHSNSGTYQLHGNSSCGGGKSDVLGAQGGAIPVSAIFVLTLGALARRQRKSRER